MPAAGFAHQSRPRHTAGMDIFHTAPLRAVAWDFDGVLNDNEEKGAFKWKATFEADIGAPIDTLQDALFKSGHYSDCLIGKADVLDPLAKWCATHAPHKTAQDILTYWLTHDFHPEPALQRMIRELDRRGITQVIATNADARRAAWVDALRDQFPGITQVFASGRMGVKKPDPAYYEHLASALDLPPAAIMVIDDVTANINAASKLHFRTYQYSRLARDNLGRALKI